MRTTTLIKSFTWTDADRSDVTLGPGTRINPKTNRAQISLRGDLGTPKGSGGYPTTSGLFVQSRTTTPRAVRQWTGFEAFVVIPTDADGVILGETRYRLHDGTDARWWDGSAWSVPGSSDWNTEQEIADNIAAWSVATLGQSLAVVVNLVSLDGTATPELLEVRLAYAAVIAFQEDLIYRTLIPLIRAGVRMIVRVLKPMPATGTTLTVAQLGLETGYNVVGIDSVFDYDALTAPEQALMLRGFPGGTADLFDSFNAGTGTVTLSTSVTVDTNLLVRFITEPEVHVWTSQEFNEDARVPAIRLMDIELLETTQAPGTGCSVANKGAGTAVTVQPPQQGTLSFTLEGSTDKAVDHQRLMEEINAFFYGEQVIYSQGMDEPLRLHLVDEYAMSGFQGQDEIHEGQARFEVPYFKRWLRPAINETIVTATEFNGVKQHPFAGMRDAGSIIEGRGPWTAQWTTEQAGLFMQSKPFAVGKELALTGSAASINVHEFTQPMLPRAIGAKRVDKAIRFSGLARYEIATSSLPAFADTFHLRAIIKDAGTGNDMVYAKYSLGAGSIALGRSGTADLYTEVLPGAGGLVTTAAVVPLASWFLLDANYDYTTDTWELFINGALVATHAGGAPARANVGALAKVQLFNDELTSRDNTGLTGLFHGLALNRQITLEQHQADALELGV